MVNKLYPLIFFSFFFTSIHAQLHLSFLSKEFSFENNRTLKYVSMPSIGEKGFHSSFEIQAIKTTNDVVPYWMRSNQYGSKPLYGLSTSALYSLSKNYDSTKKRKLDWGGDFDIRLNFGFKTEAILTQAYLKAKFGIFQIKIGRVKDISGLVDSTLSVGAFSISGNSLGIPKVELGIPEYKYLPFFNELFSIKVGISHGWFGETPLRFDTAFVHNVNSYYHQSFLYVRLGRLNSKTKFYAGITHQVMWGNERKIQGPNYFTLNNFQEFLYVILGKSYGNGNIPKSKIGNHLGSVDQAMEINFKKIYITGYHQFFYDIGALYHLNNIKDGLWGVSIKNIKQSHSIFNWKKIVFELMFSKSQGGEPDSKPTPSGAEDYYNNFQYTQGWSYKGENIGNPLFTNVNYARRNLPHHKDDFIINSRISAVNLGVESKLKKWDILTKLTYSRNFGTWATAPATRSLNSIILYNPPPYFQQVNQFSGYLEVSYPLKNGFKLSVVGALDIGGLLYNTQGGALKLSKILF